MTRRATISGVDVRPLVTHADERGALTELLRADWPQFRGFGQAIASVNLPWVIRAWHWHRLQSDAIVVISGRAAVPLYDARPGSPTHGVVQETIATEEKLVAIFVPPGVYHGYQTLGERPAVILNFPDRTYNPAAPDEERIPSDDPSVPYRWRTPT